MFKAVIFDFNGVLINDLKVHEKAYLKAAKDVGLPLTKEIIRRYISTTALQKRKLYFGDISDQTWNQIFRLKTEYYFGLVEEENPLFPEAGNVLSSLSRQYLLGLISNTPRRYFEKVFPQNLARLFQATIFGDEMRLPKPSPEALLEMMGRLKVGADQSCYVGDSVSDVRMAKRAGIRIFSVITGDSPREELIEAGSDWVIDRLSDLIRELNSMDHF